MKGSVCYCCKTSAGKKSLGFYIELGVVGCGVLLGWRRGQGVLRKLNRNEGEGVFVRRVRLVVQV